MISQHGFRNVKSIYSLHHLLHHMLIFEWFLELHVSHYNLSFTHWSLFCLHAPMVVSWFLGYHGILRQTSYAHTPQQNGILEHKNCHLTETIQILLAHGNVRFCFWGDNVPLSYDLINRMSSFVLDNQVPHSIIPPIGPEFWHHMSLDLLFLFISLLLV